MSGWWRPPGLPARPLYSVLTALANVIARGEIDVVARVAAARRAHVLRVERILEREDDAIHRHLLEVGMASIRRIELGGALQRVGKSAKFIAYGGCAGR